MMPKLENKIARLSSYVAATIIVLAPFWAFITVWPASNFGHYTALRLFIEILLGLTVIGAASLLAIDKKLPKSLVRQKWFYPLVAIVLLEIVWGLISHFNHFTGLKALGYAWIIDLRFLLFFASVFIIASRDDWLKHNWQKLILIPAVLVSIFAILQFAVLPLDFLKHFGYSQHTIFPYQTINHNHAYPRAMSFTRGANPLGAYLLMIASMSSFLLIKAKKSRDRVYYLASLLLALIGLFASFSRSAWLGVIVSLIIVIFLATRSVKARKILVISGAVIAVILASLGFALRNNVHVQNYFLHTQDNSKVSTNSNAGHLTALTSGLKNLADDPLGDGPGTSGPASIYNDEAKPRNTENYYLQIGEENGWLGLALLLAFFFFVGFELARRKTKLALALLASFVGLAVVNFLLPAWTDVTLAYIFWGLAGLVLGSSKLKH